ncbi:MAG: hypothetical protein LBL76_08240 [Treponema sp.]|nr:hypothetical protein [Treponema sp.]
MVLPITIYGTMLVGLRYTARVSMPISLSIMSLVILGLGCTGVLTLGISRIRVIPVPISQDKILSLGEPGLLLPQTDKSVVFLSDPHKPQSPQVISVQDKPLIYEPVPQADALAGVQGMSLSPFRINAPAALQGICNDLASTATQFGTRLNQGFIPFIIYTGGLMVLLSSLRVIFTLGAWPLANLCIGILAFRGVLALEALLNTPRIQSDLFFLVGERIPKPLLSSLLLYLLGLFLILYTAVFHLIKSRSPR